MLIDYRLFHPVGLTHAGTFLIGLYSQPLGFVLLICWYVIYTKANQRPWHFALASTLLALTVLANFFSAITAFVFVMATLVDDSIRFYKATDRIERGEHSLLLFHLGSPIVA